MKLVKPPWRAGRPSLADVATIGLRHERALRDQVLLAEQLQTALHSRIMIEQAKGVLSARAGISVGEAFSRMRGHARRTGEQLTAVAEAIVAGSLEYADLRPVSDLCRRTHRRRDGEDDLR